MEPPLRPTLLQFIVEYMQLLSIMRLASVQQQWSTGTSWAYSIIGLTPLSTAGWVSTDCMLPAGTSVARVTYVRVLLYAIVVPGAQGYCAQQQHCVVHA
jgi:hypothetical protein